MFRLIGERAIREALRRRAVKNLRPVRLELLHILREALRSELEELEREQRTQQPDEQEVRHEK